MFQAPLSWFAKAQTWGLSPGYDQQDQGFQRPILPVCVSCHAGSAGRGIGCADCHGEGPNHRVVNPAKLSLRLADEICMRCHQDGDVRVLQPGKREGEFRPGQRLSETVALFRIPGAASTGLLDHHRALATSRCFTASGGKLACLSCHDPHGGQPDYRAKCLGCHAKRPCTLPRKQRGAADNCTGCHMPKREERQISHTALTQHRIVRRAGEAEPAEAPNLPGLIYLNGSPQELAPVTLLQAYAPLADRGALYQRRYLELLEQARRSDPEHPFVLAALGRKALRENDPRAAEYLARAVGAGAISPVPYQDLAEAWTRAGRPEKAARALREGIGRFPYAAVLQKLLASRYIDLHDYPAARSTITHYLELFPEDSFMRGMLRKFDAAYSNRSISPR
ncbi:MAG TPA: hypothetical protein VG672_03485 [Bryobacteraceae bacterium]|nr:hypothetical protein [Bryobacteraceae bacterium]